MAETTSAPSGGAAPTAVAAPSTPSGTDYSKSDSDLIDSLVGAGETTGEVPAETPEAPADTETLEVPQEPEAVAPEGEQPETVETPEVETPPTPEPAQAAVPSEADKLISELGLDDVAVPEARKALWKKDPASKDSFYRDLAYQRYGFTPKLAEAFYEKGVTTAQDLDHIVEGNETLTAFDRDFSDGTEQGAARLIKNLHDVNPESARNLFRTAWKVAAITDPEFAADSKAELLDIALKQMAAEFKNDPDRSDLVKAFTQMLDEYATEQPKRLAPRTVDRELKAKVDRYEQRERENVAQSAQQTKTGANQAAGRAVTDLVAKTVGSKFPQGYPLLNEVIQKVKDAVDTKVFQIDSLKNNLRYVLADDTLTPQQKQERYAALVTPVAQRFIDREFARVSKPYTAHAITTNQAQLAKAKAVATLREVGSGTAAPTRAAVQPVDYRKMSDEQILDSEMRRLSKR